jgi:hypothetical protein
MLFKRNKPRWLYAALPAIYVLAGIVALATLHNLPGRVGGGLLLLAGISILVLRRSGARASRAAEASPQSSVFAPTSRLAATTELVRAIVPPPLGHQGIDRQHRGLASRAATLRVALAHNDDHADLEALVHELIETLEQHVDDEIVAMGRLDVVRAEQDVAADRARLASARHDIDLHRSGGMTMEALVDRIAGTLVAGHLMGRHPPLPSMDSMLLQLRQAKPSN